MWTSVSLSLGLLSRVIILEPESVSNLFLLVHFVAITHFVYPLVFVLVFISSLVHWGISIIWEFSVRFFFCLMFSKYCRFAFIFLPSCIWNQCYTFLRTFPLRTEQFYNYFVRVCNIICHTLLFIWNVVLYLSYLFFCFSFFK